MDCGVIVTRDKSDVSKVSNKDSEVNYLYITPSNRYVKYIRNKYKTSKGYGRKVISISAKKFANAANEFLVNDYFENHC